MQLLIRQNNNTRFIKDPSQKRGIFYLRTFLIVVLFCTGSIVSAQAKIKFKENKKDLGTVNKGDVVSAEYEFTNEGDQPLILTNYEVECSCTSADLPKQPIAPGQSGKITVKFDTKSAYDRQDRKVVILSNAKNSASVRIKCFVKKP
jgi:hypothetical protein